MKKKLNLMLAVLLTAILAVTPVYAGNIALSGGWGSSAIHFDGFAKGVGGYDGITFDLIGVGTPLETVCVNQGGNQAPGQNPASFTGDGSITFTKSELDATTKKGKTPVYVMVDEDSFIIPGTEAGCPSDNWHGEIVEVDWTEATINVYDGVYYGGIPADATLLKTFVYTCYPDNKVPTGDGHYILDCKLVSSTTY